MNRRCRIFDRPDGRGLVGTITDVYDEFSFRFISDKGKEYDFTTSGQMAVQVHYLDEGEN